MQAPIYGSNLSTYLKRLSYKGCSVYSAVIAGRTEKGCVKKKVKMPPQHRLSFYMNIFNIGVYHSHLLCLVKEWCLYIER